VTDHTTYLAFALHIFLAVGILVLLIRGRG
jgi:hypothetical protein